ncbi:type III restriction endonuclease subunit R [Pasteurellaceae bacterium LFhippo2]|nr:type III restriction endonuclease subunit R [Pasteurellaceae bacterium LFhippo2]
MAVSKKTKQTSKKTHRTFHNELVLNQWLMSLFYKDLAGFSTILGNLEGLSETGQTRFFEAIVQGLVNTDKVSEADLRRYDLNIIQHWQRITEKRNQRQQTGVVLEMKYFQYLTLLFTEIYLDWYFNRQERLIAELNRFLADRAIQSKSDKSVPVFQNYIPEDLNKIAYWNATGSGKTLLMHVNILQYQHYADTALSIFLLTPNEGLSQQHLEELQASDFDAMLFDKQKGVGLYQHAVQIIDIHKLAEKSGDKTVAVSSFEGRNKLVLVDEGHRGMSGAQWLNLRNQLIGDGFAFEYSATFGQAVKKEGKTVEALKNALLKKKGELDWQDELNLRQQSIFENYAKSILFDYSYKYFYGDGYGKESLILNLDGDYLEQGDNDKKYFVAGLLAFYQQLYLFSKNEQSLSQIYHIEKPLWVFVGSKVNDDDSDVLLVLKYIAYFLNHPDIAKGWLAELLEGRAFLDKSGQPIFRNRFLGLGDWKDDVDGLYNDILKQVFNSESPQRLQLTNLKKAGGELALQVGKADYFGVINIGDDSKFFKMATEQTEFDCENDEFSDGLFGKLNEKSNPLQLLIGSKKFSEGWSSWRVSTMGLLNIGKSEGPQVIQLFGRGVRLKGKYFSLKRTKQGDPLAKSLQLNTLETLNIFGVRANYIQQFREYLKEEEIETEDEVLELCFDTKPRLPANPLKTLRLKAEYKDNRLLGFKRQQAVELYEIPAKWQGKLKKIEVVLDLYPRLEALSTTESIKTDIDVRNEGKLNATLFAMFDWDKIYLDLLKLKLQKTWFNLRLNREKVRQFVENNSDWYRLYIPQAELAINDFGAVAKQQKILQELLALYTEQFYQRLKSAYENEYYELVDVDSNNGSFIDQYTFTLNKEDSYNSEEKLIELEQLIRTDKLAEALKWQAPFNELHAIVFPSHLYQPLFRLEKGEGLPLTLAPIGLNEGEAEFVQALQHAEQTKQLEKWIGNRSLYLLRNAANKNRGLGFALAGNFYPDFLLWVVDNQAGKQWLSFVDPKGIRNLNEYDPKFGLHQEVKELEGKLNNPQLSLSAFILSVTKQQDLINLAHKTEEEFAEQHILFMSQENYLQRMFELMLGDE